MRAFQGLREMAKPGCRYGLIAAFQTYGREVLAAQTPEEVHAACARYEQAKAAFLRSCPVTFVYSPPGYWCVKNLNGEPA